jgi:predicted esterase
MEIQHEMKDPPGIEPADVVAAPPQQPLVLLLGCGAAHARIDFMSLPAQFRRNHAALVISPIAELLANDAPEIARVFIETVAACRPDPKPAGEVLLETKRKVLAEGRLAGLLLLSAGDASWLLAG